MIQPDVENLPSLFDAGAHGASLVSLAADVASIILRLGVLIRFAVFLRTFWLPFLCFKEAFDLMAIDLNFNEIFKLPVCLVIVV